MADGILGDKLKFKPYQINFYEVQTEKLNLQEAVRLVLST